MKGINTQSLKSLAKKPTLRTKKRRPFSEPAKERATNRAPTQSEKARNKVNTPLTPRKIGRKTTFLKISLIQKRRPLIEVN